MVELTRLERTETAIEGYATHPQTGEEMSVLTIPVHPLLDDEGLYFEVRFTAESLLDLVDLINASIAKN